MAAIPTINEEEARRPNRDETISSANVHGSSIKAILARFGIRAFKPNLRKAAEKLEALHTAKGMPLPERSRAELRRNLGRLHLLREQIHEIRTGAVAAALGGSGHEEGSTRNGSPSFADRRRRYRDCGHAGE
ncbi:hypothetical protein [Mesorhizobium sp.]|uniref:hypothetical protein n=1 Tax=Mesorhizobium sp. TaxID=1871066 RepID=UPI0025E9A1FA|nr:hypothetical protein [Mesorhizobium sp.]